VSKSALAAALGGAGDDDGGDGKEEDDPVVEPSQIYFLHAHHRSLFTAERK
jgi:hypothetical protein